MEQILRLGCGVAEGNPRGHYEGRRIGTASATVLPDSPEPERAAGRAHQEDPTSLTHGGPHPEVQGLDAERGALWTMTTTPKRPRASTRSVSTRWGSSSRAVEDHRRRHRLAP